MFTDCYNFVFFEGDKKDLDKINELLCDMDFNRIMPTPDLPKEPDEAILSYFYKKYGSVLVGKERATFLKILPLYLHKKVSTKEMIACIICQISGKCLCMYDVEIDGQQLSNIFDEYYPYIYGDWRTTYEYQVKKLLDKGKYTEQLAEEGYDAIQKYKKYHAKSITDWRRKNWGSWRSGDSLIKEQDEHTLKYYFPTVDAPPTKIISFISKEIADMPIRMKWEFLTMNTNGEYIKESDSNTTVFHQL